MAPERIDELGRLVGQRTDGQQRTGRGEDRPKGVWGGGSESAQGPISQPPITKTAYRIKTRKTTPRTFC